MTVIVYHNGILATDSKVIVHQNNKDMERVSFSEKAWQSKCKRMYMATAGTLLASGAAETMEKFAAKMIQKFHHEGRVQVALDWQADKIHMIPGEYIVMTRGLTYLLGDDTYGMKLVSPEDIITMGSGCWIARAAVMAGQNAVEAVKTTIRLDAMCGGTTHVYTDERLKVTRLPKPKVLKAVKK